MDASYIISIQRRPVNFFEEEKKLTYTFYNYWRVHKRWERITYKLKCIPQALLPPHYYTLV